MQKNKLDSKRTELRFVDMKTPATEIRSKGDFDSQEEARISPGRWSPQ